MPFLSLAHGGVPFERGLYTCVFKDIQANPSSQGKAEIAATKTHLQKELHAMNTVLSPSLRHMGCLRYVNHARLRIGLKLST